MKVTTIQYPGIVSKDEILHQSQVGITYFQEKIIAILDSDRFTIYLLVTDLETNEDLEIPLEEFMVKFNLNKEFPEVYSIL